MTLAIIISSIIYFGLSRLRIVLLPRRGVLWTCLIGVGDEALHEFTNLLQSYQVNCVSFMSLLLRQESNFHIYYVANEIYVYMILQIIH